MFVSRSQSSLSRGDEVDESHVTQLSKSDVVLTFQIEVFLFIQFIFYKTKPESCLIYKELYIQHSRSNFKSFASGCCIGSAEPEVCTWHADNILHHGGGYQ